MYKLHGVLVHSGDLHGGHYFALIKPDKHTRWLKFDDDRVTPVTDKEVLEENYGGEVMNGTTPAMQRNQVRTMKRFTNAYMLVYIRQAVVDEILAPFTEEDTPAHLSTSKRAFVGFSMLRLAFKSAGWMRSVCRSRRRSANGKNNISI